MRASEKEDPVTLPTLQEIMRFCVDHKINITKQRQQVLEIMHGFGKMISAYDLLDALRLIDPKAKPTTVYRALDFFLEHGLIHKVESDNRYILCHHLHQPHHRSILLICDVCQSITEQSDIDIEQALLQSALAHDFVLTHRIIELHGRCHACQKQAFETKSH